MTTASRIILTFAVAVALATLVQGQPIHAGLLAVVALVLWAAATRPLDDFLHVCDPPEDGPPAQPWICPGCDREYMHAGNGVWRDAEAS